MLHKLIDAICGRRCQLVLGCFLIGSAPMHFVKNQGAFGILFGLYGVLIIATNWRR